jgi:hypothetical protein
MTMGLNLKDEETVALVTEVAQRLGTTKTAAVRELARQRLAELDSAHVTEVEERIRALNDWMALEIWPKTAGTTPYTKAELNDILGYADMLNP